MITKKAVVYGTTALLGAAAAHKLHSYHKEATSNTWGPNSYKNSSKGKRLDKLLKHGHKTGDYNHPLVISMLKHYGEDLSTYGIKASSELEELRLDLLATGINAVKTGVKRMGAGISKGISSVGTDIRHASTGLKKSFMPSAPVMKGAHAAGVPIGINRDAAKGLRSARLALRSRLQKKIAIKHAAIGAGTVGAGYGIHKLTAPAPRQELSLDLSGAWGAGVRTAKLLFGKAAGAIKNKGTKRLGGSVANAGFKQLPQRAIHQIRPRHLVTTSPPTMLGRAVGIGTGIAKGIAGTAQRGYGIAKGAVNTVMKSPTAKLAYKHKNKLAIGAGVAGGVGAIAAREDEPHGQYKVR